MASLNSNVEILVLEIFRDYRLLNLTTPFSISEANLKLKILVPRIFIISKFQAPIKLTSNSGLFCPLMSNVFNPGHVSILIVTNGLIELFTEL